MQPPRLSNCSAALCELSVRRALKKPNWRSPREPARCQTTDHYEHTYIRSCGRVSDGCLRVLGAAEAAEAVSRGYTSHKIKGRPWWDIYAQIEAVRDATPAYYHLDIDWNQMLVNASRATPVLQRLDEYPIVDIYESPIPQGDVEGNRQLRSKISRPIAHHFGNPPFPTVVRDAGTSLSSRATCGCDDERSGNCGSRTS